MTVESEKIKQREAEILEKNWDKDHTRPAVPHYDHKWLWDSVFASVINNRRGLPEKAETEIKSIFNGMDSKTGFIPNMNYLTGHNWRDIEAPTFKRPDIGSGYTQPPVIAMGAYETYETYKKQGKKQEGMRFLQDVYGEVSPQGEASGLQGFYSYFEKYRENGNGSKLIGNVHPHETGRDSDPSLRPDLPLIPGKSRSAGLLNGALDYGSILALNVKLKMHDLYPERGRPTIKEIADSKGRRERRENKNIIRYDWDPAKIRDVYWVNDVMFNALYANNLRYMSEISHELGKQNEEQHYTKLASEVEHEILDKMWNEEDGIFYNLDKKGKQIKVASVTSLFPLTLDTISPHQLTKLTEKLEDPEWFNTPYPIPSVPANSKYYNPHYTEPRLWKRGEVWINTNQLIAEEGLTKQLQRTDLSPELRERVTSVLANLVNKTEKLVKDDLAQTGTTHEFYDPDPKGKKVTGYRIPGFTWSLGGLHLDKSKEVLNPYKQEEQAA